jgi:hypothetical protein
MKAAKFFVLSGVFLIATSAVAESKTNGQLNRMPATAAENIMTGGVLISSVDCDVKVNGQNTLISAQLEFTVHHVNPADPLILIPYSLRYHLNILRSPEETFGFLMADSLGPVIKIGGNWIGEERSQSAQGVGPRVQIIGKISGDGDGQQGQVVEIRLQRARDKYSFTCKMDY